MQGCLVQGDPVDPFVDYAYYYKTDYYKEKANINLAPSAYALVHHDHEHGPPHWAHNGRGL